MTIKMDRTRNLYFIPPLKDDLEILSSADYKHAIAERQFMEEYRKRTGTPWLSFYSKDGPRPPPVLTMWPTAYIGQKHEIVTEYGHYTCHPDKVISDEEEASSSGWFNWGDKEKKQGSNEPSCMRPDALSMYLQVISLKPRVFVIENLLSPWECDHIVALGEKVVRRSTVGQENGGFESKTRTSSTGWIARNHDKAVSQVFARFADVLGLEQDMSRIAEELQIVRYVVGQEYTPHHDFSDAGRTNVRFLTLLLHIAPSEQGGATGFPKAANGRGLGVRPAKGSAVLFYNMLPDGNGDDLSLHSGRPIVSGVKWVCNLWIWDPKR